MEQFTTRDHSLIFADEPPSYSKWSYNVEYNLEIIFGRTLEKELQTYLVGTTSVRWNFSYEKGNLQRVQKAFLA